MVVTSKMSCFFFFTRNSLPTSLSCIHVKPRNQAQAPLWKKRPIKILSLQRKTRKMFQNNQHSVKVNLPIEFFLCYAELAPNLQRVYSLLLNNPQVINSRGKVGFQHSRCKVARDFSMTSTNFKLP